MSKALHGLVIILFSIALLMSCESDTLSELVEEDNTVEIVDEDDVSEIEEDTTDDDTTDDDTTDDDMSDDDMSDDDMSDDDMGDDDMGDDDMGDDDMGDDNESSDLITYENRVATILNNACIECHNSVQAAGGVQLNTFELARQSAESGRMIARMVSTNSPMPPSGNLPDVIIDDIMQWIADGLLEN